MSESAPGHEHRAESAAPDARRIVIVGPCASGKSTLVAALRDRGYDARVCAQEHSAIPALWRHSEPDVVIALDADIAAVRRRRDSEWPAWLHAEQMRRLGAATEAADLRIDTSLLEISTVIERTVAFLEEPHVS
jgi:hypothetical protein